MAQRNNSHQEIRYGIIKAVKQIFLKSLMNSRLLKLERGARCVMGFIALLALAFLLCLKTGLVNDDSTYYKEETWYLTTQYFGMAMLSQYSSREECEQHLKKSPDKNCKSGKELKLQKQSLLSE